MLRKIVRVVRLAARDAVDDHVLTYAGALAFYSALSLPPILVILLWLLGSVGAGAEESLEREAALLMGEQGRELVASLLDNAERRVELDGPAGWISGLTLLFAATGVFSQLQLALNRVWEVKPRPGAGFTGWLRKRLLSLGFLGVLAFLMLVSLTTSTLVSAAGLAGEGGLRARAGEVIATIVVFTVSFAAVFKLLPDVKIRWREVWGGAFVTALLYAAGKGLIGAYLAHRGLGSTYGAAGSAIVVLVWVYFSAVVALAGAEITQAWIETSGRGLEPNRHAVRVDYKKGKSAREPREAERKRERREERGAEREPAAESERAESERGAERGRGAEDLT